MKLYCMRHGQALDASEDPERSLSEIGAEQVQRLGRHLQAANINFSHIMCSDKMRTQQTAQIMADIISPEVKINISSCLSNNAECSDLLEDISNWNDDTLLVGHLPMMDDLVNLLLTRSTGSCLINFVPATIICLEKRQLLDWALSWVVNPNLLVDERGDDAA